MNWTKLAGPKTYPKSEVPVIVFVRGLTRTRRLRAMWIPPLTVEADLEDENHEYDEATDTYFVLPGWYERNEYEDTHWLITGVVTHWQPLPEPPEGEWDAGP